MNCVLEAECRVQFSFPGLADGDYEVAFPALQIEFKYTPGTPPDIDFVSAKLIDGDGLNPAEDQLFDWARDFLTTDHGYEMACRAADRARAAA